ncbi:hypothetical protein M011DRAFT_469450 [Sporormia fimetaria CBS 119925]|uniref:Methyltransferase type 11 domain-containing protein n=1 Tax=Sporormia fimetaria CBS 119925 TaxID=1340428 RepID=A0A6A6V6Q8_9PLEO|nr:hypothetical protein M011DRAFT_469450 [Sporormia fimetaria CBS 119925]
MYPRQQVHYLATEPQGALPLSENVCHLRVLQPGMIPLPYLGCSFSHIRTSKLPSLVPSSQLPQLFSEFHRVLAPGGMLEIRVMDAAPVRSTAGPKMRMWIEDRLLLNLEKKFRCSKPCSLISTWLFEAGFDLPAASRSEAGDTMKLVGVAPTSASIYDKLSMLVGRAMWKDIWGDYVSEALGESRWWWEDEEVVAECVAHQTVFECGAIFAFKRLSAPSLFGGEV